MPKKAEPARTTHAVVEVYAGKATIFSRHPSAGAARTAIYQLRKRGCDTVLLTLDIETAIGATTE